MLNQNQQLQEADIKMEQLPLNSVCQLYRISIGEGTYIAKIFPINKPFLYQQEIEKMSRLHHPNILKLLPHQNSLINKLKIHLKRDVIVSKEAKYGSFHEWMIDYGPFNEEVSWFYLNQLINALAYAEKQAQLSHSNLNLSNMLMQQSRNLLITGWNNTLQNKKSTSIVSMIGQIAVALRIGKSPFINKESPTDPYGKLVKQNIIFKFWQQIEKNMRRKDKQFQFSGQYKQFVNGLLLNKVENLQQAEKHQNLSNSKSLEFIQQELVRQEENIEISKGNRIKKIRENQNTETQLIKNINAPNNNTLNVRSQALFVEQYNLFKQNVVVSAKQQNERGFFRIFSTDLRMIYAHLKMFLKQIQQSEDKFEEIFDPMLVFHNFDIQIQKGSFLINLNLGWNIKQIGSSQLMNNILVSIQVECSQHLGQLYSRAKIIDTGQIDEQRIQTLVYQLKQTLKYYA